MFLHVSVILSTGRGLAGGVSRPIPRGEVGGSHWGGLQAQVGGISQHALRQTPPKQTATAADGTHPTGMHSCSNLFLLKRTNKVYY